MCGIAGFTSALCPEPDRVVVMEAMLSRLHHRGPESRGTTELGGVTLGATELRFTAPSRATQPLVDGTVAVAWNGEIYNADRLRPPLELRLGRQLGESDTALVAALYHVHGLDFVDHLEGMYAIALADVRLDRLVLARDPFGQKPLYWAARGGGIVFASELTALVEHPRVEREPDRAAAAAFLVFNHVPSPACMIAGVRKLRAGHLLVVDHRGPVERRFWSIPRMDVSASLDEGQVAEAIRGSVAEQLRASSFPLGVLLSGGIDSALVAAHATDVLGAAPPLFTVGFQASSYDESADARAPADARGATIHTVIADDLALAREAETLLAAMDEPLADPALLPQSLVCRFAREHVKGVLSGDGADELFLGYPFFRASVVMQWLAPVLGPRICESLARAASRLPLHETNMHPAFLLRLLARGLGAPAERRFYASTGAFAATELQALFGEPEPSSPFDELDGLIRDRTTDAGRRCQLGMIRHFLTDGILTKVDRASMRWSLEVRAPFLSRAVAEPALACHLEPGRLWAPTKPTLRRIAARRLPAAIVGRKKRGLRIPLARLIRTTLREPIFDRLGSEALDVLGISRRAEVARLLREHDSGASDHQKPIWALYCLHRWLEGGFEASPAPASAPWPGLEGVA